jgi:hypothetical protein
MKSQKCREKVVFNTQAEANAAGVAAKYRYGTKLKSYRCKDCNMWHLASKF